ncbi:MAG: tRNA uridine(34) hydroxylase, partial [Parachlamydiaceae bacterium]|nr:tRNA uridine(34) hydroxylase [Parachlamydiaceae bacterium]
GTVEDAEAYMAWIKSQPLFENIVFKIHYYHENVFPRQVVKYRKQLVALDEKVDLSVTGKHASPEEWKSLLESSEKPVVLDIRNDYEWEVGRFKGAERPPCKTFRDFMQYTEELKKTVNPNAPVMMYCTGGIRCELYSSVLLNGGFKNVYQLDGGVINYGLKQGSEHWLGKLFVFDDRLTVPISNEETEVIGKCFHCQSPIENYYNCASMDCNELFLCCEPCLKQFDGCCSTECKNNTSRVRPFAHQNPHKPFRRWYEYFKEKRN